MTLLEQYKTFLKLKSDLNLLRIRNKKISLALKIKKTSDEIVAVKKELKISNDIRNKELIRDYKLNNYIRSDGQYSNLNKLEDDPIFSKILEDTKTFDGSIKERMFILRYQLDIKDYTCEVDGCNNNKTFNKATNYFKTICDCCTQDDLNKLRHEKAKKTNLDRYGVDNQNQIKNLVRKNKVPHSFKKHPATKKIDNDNDLNKEYIQEHFINETRFELIKMMSYFKLSSSACYKKIKEFDIGFRAPSNFKELDEYIKTLTPYILSYSDDIITVDERVAFAYNELDESSYNGTNHSLYYYKNRQINTTSLYKEQNIPLYHIFENEWKDPIKNQIWKSQISNALGKNKIVIGARKCKIVEVSHQESSEFLTYNHLQGKSVSGIQIALKYNDEIVSIMTFGKSRYDKNIDYEMMRFCSKLFTQVPGAASKLLKYFNKEYQPKALVSYANARWSTGKLYKTLGFKEESFSNPNYFYYHKDDKTILHSRVQFQKHKLEKKLSIFDPELTEMQNMVKNGYRSIYDSGNYKFTYVSNK